MNPDLILIIGLAALIGALVVACIVDNRRKPAAPVDLQAKPVNVIELPEGEPYDHSAVESDDYRPPTAIYAEAADTPDGEPTMMTIPEAIEAGVLGRFTEVRYVAVERRANVGELVKMTTNDLPYFKEGEIHTVIEACEDGTDLFDNGYCAVQEDYVVLEPVPAPDKPAVVSVTQPKQPRQYDVERADKAKAKADQAADFIRRGATPGCAAGQYGYSGAESLRKALNRWGYRLNGQPKEVKV